MFTFINQAHLSLADSGIAQHNNLVSKSPSYQFCENGRGNQVKCVSDKSRICELFNEERLSGELVMCMASLDCGLIFKPTMLFNCMTVTLHLSI